MSIISNKISIFEYLALHYNDHLKDHPKNHDYDQDQKLPFVAHSQTLSFCFISPQPIFVEFKTIPTTKESGKIMPVNDRYSDNIFHSYIWQPPKSC